MRHAGSRQHGGYVAPKPPQKGKRHQRGAFVSTRPAHEQFARLIRRLNHALDDRNGQTIDREQVTQLERRIDRIVEQWEAAAGS